MQAKRIGYDSYPAKMARIQQYLVFVSEKLKHETNSRLEAAFSITRRDLPLKKYWIFTS